MTRLAQLALLLLCACKSEPTGPYRLCYLEADPAQDCLLSLCDDWEPVRAAPRSALRMIAASYGMCAGARTSASPIPRCSVG